MIRQMEYKSTQYKCKEDLNLNSVKEFYEDKFEQLHPLIKENLKFINLKKKIHGMIYENISLSMDIDLMAKLIKLILSQNFCSQIRTSQDIYICGIGFIVQPNGETTRLIVF
jgi:hypothetical protein